VTDAEDPVAAYKRLLRTLVARRPSGTRKRIAAAFGAHPSFVSQITNPALRVPLPAQHLPALFRVCHFTADERAQFLALYARAHPAAPLAAAAAGGPERDALRIVIPPMADRALRAEVEALIRDFAERVIGLAVRRGEQGGGAE
jgi:hypothetical protein